MTYSEKQTRYNFLTLRSFGAIILSLTLVVFISGCLKNKTVENSADLEALGKTADIDPTTLKPGLSVLYYSGFWRHIYVMPKPEIFKEKGWPGKPIKKIDHRFEKGEVFDSGKTRGIGVQMEGFIKLPQKGLWEFKAKSNDGIDIKIALVQVVWDPTQHPDRVSKPMEFKAAKPGVYPILVRYFQRKGTATLEFYWKPPGVNEFTIIPESAYWHYPGPT